MDHRMTIRIPKTLWEKMRQLKYFYKIKNYNDYLIDLVKQDIERRSDNGK